MEPVNSLDPSNPGWGALLRQNTQSPLADTVDPSKFYHIQTDPSIRHLPLQYQLAVDPGTGWQGSDWSEPSAVNGLANSGGSPAKLRYLHERGNLLEEEIYPGEAILGNNYDDYTPIHENNHLQGGLVEYTDPNSGNAENLQHAHPSMYALEAYNARDKAGYDAAIERSPYGGWDKATNANLDELGADGSTYIRELLRSHPQGSFANDEYGLLSRAGKAPAMSQEDYVAMRDKQSYIQQQIEQLRKDW